MSKKLFGTAWSSVMDEHKNPLQYYSLPTAHLLMQLLAWMWSAVFSIAIGSYMAFGISAITHVLLLGALFTTLMVFQNAHQKGAVQRQ